MRQLQGGNASTYLLMCVATIGFTIGIALALCPQVDRTPSFVLSLTMTCFALATLFAFPVYHARASADRGEPAFAFGFGFQAALVGYATAVAGLWLVSGVGTIEYSLTERAEPGVDAQIQSSRVTGTTGQPVTFHAREHAVLAINRPLPAGGFDIYQVETAIKADAAGGARFGNCGAVQPVFLTRTRVSGGGQDLSSDDCLGWNTTIVQAGDLELRKTMVSGPLARAGDPGVFNLKYRIEVRNKRWLASFHSLAVAHAVLFLWLLLTACVWHMGSATATQAAVLVTAQRRAFRDVTLKTASIAASVALNRDLNLKPFVKALKSLNDDVAHATPETLPGLEDFNDKLVAALERLCAEYAGVLAKESATGAAQEDVQLLVASARAIAVTVGERDAAIRAAR